MTPFIDSQSIELDSLSRQRIVKAIKAFHLSGKQLPHQFCPYQAIFTYYQHALSLRASQNTFAGRHSFPYGKDYIRHSPTYQHRFLPFRPSPAQFFN